MWQQPRNIAGGAQEQGPTQGSFSPAKRLLPGEGHSSRGAGRLLAPDIHSPHAVGHTPAAGASAKTEDDIIPSLDQPAERVRLRRSYAAVGGIREFRRTRPVIEVIRQEHDGMGTCVRLDDG